MRRRPQQERGQQRVDLILDTAAELVAEEGYEALTTNAIAERAGISIGSLYRYFPDKSAILYGLAIRHMEHMQATYDHVFTEDLARLDLAEIIDRIIDPFVALHAANPEFKQMLLGSDVSPEIAAASEEMDEAIGERLADFLRQAAPDLEEQRARLVARVCKAEVKALLSLITPDSEETFRAQVITEMKRMLYNYLAPMLGRQG
jgi:AcrR family transcriptional regulator